MNRYLVPIVWTRTPMHVARLVRQRAGKPLSLGKLAQQLHLKYGSQ